MKNLSIRFILAGLVAGFTYLAFLSFAPDSTRKNHAHSSPSFTLLLAQSIAGDSAVMTTQNEQVRKLNYAKFRRSLLKHRSIYYAQD